MNKSLLSVARVISMITGIMYCITFILIPIGILNIIASNKFSEAEKGGNVSRETVRNWSIYLLFTDTISGVLGIIASTNEDSDVIDVSTSASAAKSSPLEERLNNLSKLYDSGVISRDEYDRRRREIIDQI